MNPRELTTDEITRETIRFTSAGIECEAWFFAASVGSAFASDAGVPVVVMAHGFGGTKDSGLEPYARRLAAAGLAVWAFDYRNFGLSDGTPRQRVSVSAQIADYQAAIDAAAAQPGVDPGRIVVWGPSLAGGHVLIVAAERARRGSPVAAVIAMVPLVSGPAAGIHHLPQAGAAAMLGSAARGVGSAVGARFGRDPVRIPIVGGPHQRAALTAPGFAESYHAIAGPSWRNEIDASIGLEIGGYRADRSAPHVGAPLLVQIADFDRAAPPHAAAKAAFAGRAEVRHYPCDHFDVFEAIDPAVFGRAVDHQIRFLTRHLGGPGERAAGEQGAGEHGAGEHGAGE
ncbi:MAG: alpha/beta hydrolase [Gordonia sp. (in: high G+C Gram-positive bacteria)]